MFSAIRKVHDNTTGSLIWLKKSESVSPMRQLKTKARKKREFIADASSFGQQITLLTHERAYLSVTQLPEMELWSRSLRGGAVERPMWLPEGRMNSLCRRKCRRDWDSRCATPLVHGRSSRSIATKAVHGQC